MVNILKKVKEIEVSPGEGVPKAVVQSLTPVVLRGLVREWPIVIESIKSSSKAIDYLNAFYNGKSTLVNFGTRESNGRYFYNDDVSSLNYESRRAQIDEVLNELSNSINSEEAPSCYISSAFVDTYFPGLRAENDLHVPRVRKPYPVPDLQMKIWIGTPSIASCHYDALDNIACCVAGNRRFTIFPPEQVGNLYLGPLELTPGGQAISMVDFNNPDFQKYPRFRKALEDAQVAELGPGDAIYIPSMWMHHVEGLSPFNILINYWWDDAPQHTGSGMNVLYHALLTLRDKPQHEKEGWKRLFDYYIFGDPEVAGAHLPEQSRGFLGELDKNKVRQLRAMLINRLNR